MTAQPSFATVDPTELFVCPYDPVHRISAKRLPYHLSKCRKIHNAKDYVRCPLNARHEIPRQELTFHLSLCPDKDVIRQNINPTFVPQSSNRPATPPPTEGILEASEDWGNDEPVNEHFIPSNARGFHNSESVDSYAVVQMLSEAQEELHGSSIPPASSVNFADMTPAQKRNYKKALKRKQKKAEQNGSEGPEMTDQEKLNAIIKKYPLMSGRDEGGFVDFVSRLNIHCQQNKINLPTYKEGPGIGGGYGYQVIIQTDIFSTNKYCKTKKDAKQNAAMVAFLGLDIKFGVEPIPNRATSNLTAKEKDRMKETHEKQLLREAGYQQTFKQTPSTAAGGLYTTQLASNGHTNTLELNQAMGTVSIQEKGENDGWTTVTSKSGRPVNPVFDYSLKVAGRGRGIPRT